MDNNPLISIIVVSFNHEKYLEENLNSIKAQTYTNIELIVADDASSDNSVTVINRWLTENNYTAKLNFHSQNTGVSTVLNECISLAEGKYIKIIAADDFLHDEAIEKSIAKLEESGDQYGMVYTDTYSINENSDIVEDIADYNSLYFQDSETFYNWLVISNRIAALTVVIRKSVLVKTGAYDERFIVDDYYRWLKVSQLYKIAYIPEKLSYYRLHSSNISKLKAERIKREDIVLKIMFDKNGVAKDIIRYYIIMELIKNNKLNEEVLEEYKKYPFKNKILESRYISYLPPLGLKVLNKLLKFSD
ncbi:glycosyltransferase [Elizabethkingia anophelis]|uniref:glycosyltransferase family 2 protein n=1 Tax=Elizabethkingia anophelis TaxID=1117645 RepID=UPI0004E2E95F|nr:glycosyltransferase [Elizabethkingia anophelis]KFC39652.1 hypothetical protein FF18_10540 [Elizabethkingia anophelis]MCT3764189.1 glycosyltransferase [Elizabethkingia anophelis]MCT3788338.1 glycosyltransferase [Elizabethkingia anophelis]MCT3834350.1 glycosyltransferase [Elizabethkingia anophelis]MCT3898509.1 glycosyltransferase [Elizabethkingia anophelis]